MSRNRWIALIILCVLGLTGIILTSKKEKVNVDTTDHTKIIATTDDIIGDNVYGNKNAKVVMIEYGDFQCPGCTDAHKTFQTVLPEYKDKVAFVFRNFPLTQIHPNAYAASSTAEAAGLQGKFWEMYDMLYGNRESWANASVDKRDPVFQDFAGNLGLTIETYKNDLTGKKVVDKLSRDLALANKLQLQGTPSFFLNGRKLDDAETKKIIGGDTEFLKKLFDEELGKS